MLQLIIIVLPELNHCACILDVAPTGGNVQRKYNAKVRYVICNYTNSAASLYLLLLLFGVDHLVYAPVDWVSRPGTTGLCNS